MLNEMVITVGMNVPRAWNTIAQWKYQSEVRPSPISKDPHDEHEF